MAARKGDSTGVRSFLSGEAMRQVARETVHFRFINMGEGKNLDDYGFNVIEQMPEDLSAADENVELRICSVIAVYARVADMMRYELEQAKEELDQQKRNLKRATAELIQDGWADKNLLFKKTDKSVGAYAESHARAISIENGMALQRKKIIDKQNDLTMTDSASSVLKEYHKSIDMYIRRMTVGMHYAELPNPRVITKPSQPARMPEEDDDDPRDGMHSWKG